MKVLSHTYNRRVFPILFPGHGFSKHFHQFAPRGEPLHAKVSQSSQDLLFYKDWLSQPEVIRVFHSLKDPNLALPLLDKLSLRKDYYPNESIYSTVIEKLAASRNFDGIEALMLKIKGERKCRLSDKFFRNVIKIYGHSAGRINMAIQTLFDMPDYKCWPSTATFNFLLNLLVSSKQFDIVHEVYSAAPRLGVEIDACCLNIVIKGLCECGRIESAFRVLDEFPEQNCKPNVRSFSTIMHGLCQAGRVDEAFDLLKRMETESVEPDSVVFNILISGLRKHGRVKEAIELFDKIMLSGCYPNPGAHQEVLYCLLDEKRLKEAKVFMGRMIERRMNPSFESYKLLLQGFCHESLVEDAEWALNQMVANGFVPRWGTWNHIVRSLGGLAVIPELSAF